MRIAFAYLSANLTGVSFYGTIYFNYKDILWKASESIKYAQSIIAMVVPRSYLNPEKKIIVGDLQGSSLKI